MASAANGPYFPDPFRRDRSFSSAFYHAILATALFRCWHILIFFAAWSTVISVISHTTKDLGVSSTLLTVLGTVLGFVISYRTTSSFERYNEGRKYWSQIVFSTRTLARLIWFHVPDSMDMGADVTGEENKARVLIEKKTVLNLVDAFCVAVKHYLRGETDIYYEDLYHTTRYLPSYALPPGFPSSDDLTSDLPSPKSPRSVSFRQQQQAVRRQTSNARRPRSFSVGRNQREPPARSTSDSAPHLPLPATTPGDVGTKPEKLEHLEIPKPSRTSNASVQGRGSTATLGEADLLPARDPPQYSFFDLFPFSLLVKFLTKRGKKLKGKKAALLRAKLHHHSVTQNLPLEISLYISSYIAALQTRKAIDAATTSNLIAALNQLVDALTGLERILTTPIPYSYSIHLWTVTIVYCFFLPFQLWPTLKYLTIPGTSIVSFIFFGFLVAGEEIENPFGYDKNDLDMDHFTNEIIRQEIAAISATATPDPKNWVFSSVNNRFINPHGNGIENVTPDEWVSRGLGRLQAALAGQ